MEKRLKDAFEEVKMPENCARRIEAAMQVPTPRAKKPGAEYTMIYRDEKKRGFTPVLTCALLVALLAGAVAMLYGRQQEMMAATEPVQTNVTIQEKHTFENGNFTVEKGVDENGNPYSAGSYNTGSFPSWLEYDEEGRLYFTGNGEYIDLTDLISEEEPFTYIWDSPRMTQYIAVGGTAENPGYSVYYRRGEIGQDVEELAKYEGWLGGYSSGHWNNAEDEEYGWYTKAKEILQTPWS